MYIPHLKSLPHLFLKIYLLRCSFFLMKIRSKIHIVMVCKILIDGVMVVKLGKIVFTQHVHTTFEISTSFISQNTVILVCTLYIYRAINLKLGMFVYIIAQHVHVHFQVSIALHCENILDFVILYHKNGKKLIAFWSVKYTY